MLNTIVSGSILMRIAHISLFVFLSFLTKGQTQSELNWEFFNPKTQSWFVLGTSGSVQQALFLAGELPDPFYGKNEEKYQWIEDEVWTFRSRFYLTEDMYLAEQLELDFPCIDTYGEVFLNGSKVGASNNYFVPLNLSIHSQVVCGYNEVKVVITPPTIKHKSVYENQAFHYPTPNDLAPIKVASLTRKPQFQFGWDWALRMNTIGFPEPSTITIPSEVSINSVVVNTLIVNNKEADLEYVVDLKNAKQQSLTLKSNWSQSEWLIADKQRISIKIKDPKLWWPSGYGASHLYLDTLKFYNTSGQLVFFHPIQFGVRKIELIQDEDHWGTSFSFKVNGKPIFLKGANFIPPTVFNRSTSNEAWEEWVELMVQSHFNAIRIWGGGDYALEAFLKACDQKGIMVWHDAMFACAMYPGDSSFIQSVKAEFEIQFPRILAHPSVILINGNNEVDVAWKNWGFQLQYGLNKSTQTQIESDYKAVFQDLLPSVLNAYSNVPYVHTSPLSNWGKDEFYNHGTQHYWGVWHGADPMENFSTKIGRMNAEFGFQSFPEPSTLKTFAPESEWDLNSDVMKHHQKSYVGNKMILKHTQLIYGKPKSFLEFIYLSQLTQAYAVGSAISAHLLDAPRCMGSFYWQMNDCWPAPTWSSIDYFGQWKALHYKVKDLYSDVAILEKSVNQEQKLFLSGQQGKDSLLIQIKEFKLTGELISTESKVLRLEAMKGLEIFSMLKKSPARLLEISINGSSKGTFLMGTHRSNTQIETLKYKIEDMKNGKATLSFENTKFLANAWFFSDVSGVHFEQNFVHLLPGKHSIVVKYLNTFGTIKMMSI